MARQIRKEELQGATEVAPDETTAKAIGQAAKSRASRKAKLKGATAAVTDDPAPDYVALGIAESDVPTCERLRLEYAALGRLDTNQVFNRGEIVHELHQLAPEQAEFEKAAKAVLKLSRTGAENYERVFRNLGSYRERLVGVAMRASSLYDLASAEADKVEEVLAARESGASLTVEQVRAMLGMPSKVAVAPDDGGAEGLRAAVVQKSSHASKVFFDTVFGMLREVHVALEPHRAGGSVNKGKAVDVLMHDARLAGGLVESLVYAARVPGSPVPAGIIHVLPVAETRWVRLRRVLYDMGAAESWPKSEAVGSWLEQKVLPELEWALGPALAEKAKAVLDERAAAAEAERAKAEKAKARAKADARKAREKAKREKAKADKRAEREAKAAAKAAKASAKAIAPEASADA